MDLFPCDGFNYTNHFNRNLYQEVIEMTSSTLQLAYGLLLILFLLFVLRIVYFILLKFYGEFRSFLGVMIEGSEYYWKWRWKRMHKYGKIVYGKIDKYHSERGWALIPNLKNKLHYAATINSNSEGIRGIREKYSGGKVLFLGDSFCFGEGVDDHETIPYFFEKNFRNVQSINLGIHGYGIDQQYLYLKEAISKYKPTLVCFVITDNNFRRNLMDFRDYAKPKFVMKNNKIILINAPVPKPEDFIKKNFSMYRVILELIKHFFIYYGLNKKENIQTNDYILDKIKEATDKIGADLIFVYVNDARRGLWYRTYIDKYFIDYFRKKNIKYLYLEEIFGRKKLKDMFDSLSGHFSTEGNKLTADKLSEFVKSEQILK